MIMESKVLGHTLSLQSLRSIWQFGSVLNSFDKIAQGRINLNWKHAIP